MTQVNKSLPEPEGWNDSSKQDKLPEPEGWNDESKQAIT
jgi:hypothetical protein